MRQFVTADLHLGHDNMIELCHRPFRDGAHMNSELLRRFNERVKPEDSCFHLGDFCFRSSGSNKAKDWLAQMNGHVILVKGNHDGNNSAKTIIDVVQVYYARTRIAMLHDPADASDIYGGVERVNAICAGVDLVLCGHVHQNWRYQWRTVGSRKILMINVGVDQWRFYPMLLDEILKFANEIRKENK